MSRKLFCEINPITYKISVLKGILVRRIKWMIHRKQFANTYEKETLPIKIYEHKSLIRRRLGNVDMNLQENKANNLRLASNKINGIVIKPGETFSFWKLVGSCTKHKGYKVGLIIKSGDINKGIGGGMCQFTNLIHWLVLHSPLTITEHHHHNQLDMFPDYGRQVPFGTGTSIMYNYLDYQFVNHTDQEFQLIVYTRDEYLCGEIRSNEPIEYSYHIFEEKHFFEEIGRDIYRNNEVYRKVIDRKTGNLITKELIVKNHAKVMYDKKHVYKQQLPDNEHLKE